MSPMATGLVLWISCQPLHTSAILRFLTFIFYFFLYYKNKTSILQKKTKWLKGQSVWDKIDTRQELDSTCSRVRRVEGNSDHQGEKAHVLQCLFVATPTSWNAHILQCLCFNLGLERKLVLTKPTRIFLKIFHPKSGWEFLFFPNMMSFV